MPTTKNKGHRARWGRSILTWESLTGQRLYKQLHKDKILADWEGRTCPRCGNGAMGPMKYYKDKKLWAYRCKKRACHKQLQPHDYHPIFFMSAGNSSTPLQKQVAVLFCAVVGVSSNAAHLLLDMDHKPVERIYHNLEVARSQYVTQKEKDIVFGGKREDVEVDEVDIGKLTDKSVAGNVNTKWEQWGGLVERGRPSLLVLVKLNPILTKKRSPGPGPIRKRDWQPIAKKHIAGRKVILHSDRARAYKLKLPEVRHCNVVHKKKRIVINGKASGSGLNCFNCPLRDVLDSLSLGEAPVHQEI